MTARPAVTVVMPVRDPDPEHFLIAVQSVLNQTMADFELLIVEDVGDRPAAEILGKFSDARIRHLANEGIGSLAEARNRGLCEARSDLVAMFDADDMCHAERLHRQHERMSRDHDLVVLGTQITIRNDAGETTGARVYPSTHDAIVRTLPLYNPIAHPSVMLRRQSVLDAGGYRDRVCEDYDLWSRLAHLQARFANLDEDLVMYRIHAGAMKIRELRATIRDTLRIKLEHWPGQLGLRGHARMIGERLLLLLPKSLVLSLFDRLYLRQGVRT